MQDAASGGLVRGNTVPSQEVHNANLPAVSPLCWHGGAASFRLRDDLVNDA